MRYERKYEFNQGYEKVIRTFLKSKNFKKIFPDRRVNSLYYDTVDKQIYFDSINGLSNKFKVRVRFYNNNENQNFEVGGFEIKRKYAELNKKDYLNSSESLLPLDFFSNEYFSKDLRFPSNFKNIYFPSVFISYQRNYFLSHNKEIRITLDYDLELYKANKNSNYIFIGPKRVYEKNILEIKYQENHQPDFNFLEDLSKNFNLNLSRSSKYCNAVLLT
tara:strand:+ start:842 stop:1495 length:654 start_codon:yes stop_codon:yes gene_type:complete